MTNLMGSTALGILQKCMLSLPEAGNLTQQREDLKSGLLFIRTHCGAVWKEQ